MGVLVGSKIPVVLQFKCVAYNAITHHESESENECDDCAPPGVRVLVLVEVGEERLEVVGVGDALALEELLARGLRAMEEEANGVRWQLKDVQFMLNLSLLLTFQLNYVQWELPNYANRT